MLFLDLNGSDRLIRTKKGASVFVCSEAHHPNHVPSHTHQGAWTSTNARSLLLNSCPFFFLNFNHPSSSTSLSIEQTSQHYNYKTTHHVWQGIHIQEPRHQQPGEHPTGRRHVDGR